MSDLPSAQECLYRRINLERNDLDGMLAVEIINRYKQEINEQYNACSDFWSSLLENTASRNAIAKFVEITHSYLSKVWRWRERKSFPVTLPYVAAATDYMYTLIPISKRNLIKEFSAHFMWFGESFKSTLPVLVNLFAYILSTSENYEFCESVINKYEEKIPNLKTDDTCYVDVFFDRIKSVHSDTGTAFFGAIALTPYSSVKMPIRTLLLSSTSDEERIKATESFRIIDLMVLSFVLDLPLDYFCRIDYVTDTIKTAEFVKPDGSKYKFDYKNRTAVKLLAKFASHYRETQLSILKEIIPAVDFSK